MLIFTDSSCATHISMYENVFLPTGIEVSCGWLLHACSVSLLPPASCHMTLIWLYSSAFCQAPQLILWRLLQAVKLVVDGCGMPVVWLYSLLQAVTWLWFDSTPRLSPRHHNLTFDVYCKLWQWNCYMKLSMKLSTCSRVRVESDSLVS